jgi:hypothetical protein
MPPAHPGRFFYFHKFFKLLRGFSDTHADHARFARENWRYSTVTRLTLAQSTIKRPVTASRV